MIVKNEEKNLPRCLNSVRGLADEMMIVDTGSTDSTVEIARSYGANVSFFPWNGSFSDARNHAIKQATCEWLLLMDADDELEEGGQQAVLQLLEHADADAYFFETISYIGEKPGADVLKNMNVRLMRNFKGYFFSNAIHEQIFCNIKAADPDAKIEHVPIRVYHYGYLNQNIIEHDKRGRNISLLEKELAEKPDAPFTLFNLGSEYYALGDNPKAIEYFESAYKRFSPSEGFSPHLLLKMAHCYCALRRFEEAYASCTVGLTHYPQFTDLEYMKGVVRMAQGNQHAALEHFRRCTVMGEPPNPFNVIVGTGSFRAFYMQGQLYLEFEDYMAAAEALGAALESNIRYAPPFPLFIKALCRLGTPAELLSNRIGNILNQEPALLNLDLIDLMIGEKAFDAALALAEKLPAGNALTLRKAACLFCKKDYEDAYALLNSLKKTGDAADALALQALCCISLGKNGRARQLAAQALKKDAAHPKAKACDALLRILESTEPVVITESESESAAYVPAIFDILHLLLITQQFALFETSLRLLNAVTDRTVLLRLAKLYYAEGFERLAYNECIRSIKLFEHIDAEGAKMLASLKAKGL